MKKPQRFVSLVIAVTMISSVILQAPASTYAQSTALKARVTELTQDREYTLSNILVRFKPGTSEAQIQEVIERNGGMGRKLFNRDDVPGLEYFYSIYSRKQETQSKALSTDTDTESTRMRTEISNLLTAYGDEPTVEHFQPNYVSRIDVWSQNGDTDIPGDWNGATHWYYDRTHTGEMWQDQACRTGGAACGGSSNTIVAVLDTGLAYETHNRPDSTFFWWENALDYEAASEYTGANFHLYTNAGETPNNNLDDDGNGYIDDEHGYYAEVDNWCWYREYYGVACTDDEWGEMGHPNDDLGHGTYVTGMISSLVDNGAGSVSPAHNVTIMPVKVNYFALDWIETEEQMYGIVYAMVNGADVINMSFGGWSGEEGDDVDELLDIARDYYGVVSVASTGNDGIAYSRFPAAYSGVIGVGATDAGDNRATYSNYGLDVDIVAPVGDAGPIGSPYQQTYSCYFTETCACYFDSNDPLYPCVAPDWTSFNFGASYGTSFASPQVAAAVALIRSYKPNASATEVESILLGTAEDLGTTGRDNTFGYGLLNLEEAWRNIWSSWSKNGESKGAEISMEYFNGKVYQSVRGSDDGIFTRSSSNGTTWSGWSKNGATVGNYVTLVSFGGKLIQAVRGTDDGIFTRYTTNGSTWSSWAKNGFTIGDITMLEFGGKLYQTIRGTDNGIFTRSTTNGSTWSGWSKNGATIGNEVALESFGGKLYQAVRGTDNGIFTRSTTNGTTWSGWSKNGATIGDVVMENYGGRLYQVVRGTDNGVFTRYTSNGTTWSGWSKNGFTSGTKVTMYMFDSILYQSMRGTGDQIYIRYTTDGNTWSYWIENGATTGNVELIWFGQYLIQAIRGSDTGIFTRTLWHNVPVL